jgi:hypothetical protein
MGAEEIRSEPKPNLIDVIIILVICSAIGLFVFWLATRSMDRSTFDQLPEWLKGSFGGIFSVLTGSAGIGAAVVHELRRPPNTSPNYLKLIGWCLVALFAMILVVILIVRFLIPAPLPTPSPTPSPPPKTFKICFGGGGGDNCLAGADVKLDCNQYHAWNQQKWDELAANLCGYTVTKIPKYPLAQIQNNGGRRVWLDCI